jgi:hypothetical protein
MLFYINVITSLCLPLTFDCFQDNCVSFPSLLLKMLITKFDSTKGIDLEALFRFLIESHGRTGRDSVMAMHKRNDLAPRTDVSQDDIDEDLLWRIESQLIKCQDYIDLAGLRSELQKRDSGKCGIIDGPQVSPVVSFCVYKSIYLNSCCYFSLSTCVMTYFYFEPHAER